MEDEIRSEGSVPRFAADAPVDDIVAGLHAAGAVIIERLADHECCDRVAAELAPWLEQTPYGTDAFAGPQTRRTGALLGRVPASQAMIAHPTVLDVVDRALWPTKTTFQLHLTQAIAIGPDAPAQALHRDHWCFDFFAFPTGVDVQVSTIWALQDFTEANGATRLVPGSHRTPDEERSGPEDSVPATMPRGSVVLYLGSAWHGGGANVSDEVRVGINVDYTVGWLRQEENQYLTYTLDEVRAFPERVQRLLGYEVGAYALGYLDGGRDPMDLVRAPDTPGDGPGYGFRHR
ncbi:MAG: phytanoyl-CoA dioxygenase family protein [Actinomycetota bacterium]